MTRTCASRITPICGCAGDPQLRFDYGAAVVRGPIELSKSEERVRDAVLVVAAVGEVALRVVDNVTNRWWPEAALSVAVIVFAALFTAYLARSRGRSLGSVAMLSLPEFMKRRSR